MEDRLLPVLVIWWEVTLMRGRGKVVMKLKSDIEVATVAIMLNIFISYYIKYIID